MNCLSAPPGRDRITVQFRMLFSLPKSEFPIDDFAAARERQLATLCTTPDSQKMFASFDIEFVYYDPSGVYITEVNHRVEDCPK
jgi:hypothetical protein